MFQILNDSIFPSNNCRIIKSQDYMKISTARGVLDRAIKQSEILENKSRIAYELQEEYGYLDGIERAKSEQIELLVNNSKMAIDYLADIEKMVLDLVTKSIYRIFGNLETSEKIAVVVKQVLADFQNKTNMIVRFNSKDLESLEGTLAQLFPEPVAFSIEIDNNLQRGQFSINTDSGVADCSIEDHLRIFERKIRDAFA